jgi:tetratricopeptide (TPR) repeat protein
LALRRPARLHEIVARERAEPSRFVLRLRAERHRASLVQIFGAEDLALLDRRPLVADLLAHDDAAHVLVLCDVLLRSGGAELEPLGPEASALPPRDPLGLVELGRVSTPPPPRASGDGLYVDPDTAPHPRLERSGEESPDLDPPSEEGSGVFALPPESTASVEDPLAIDPNTEALRREVLAEYLTLHAKDHYQLLGVERGAATQDIALAHAAVSKRFRLERFAGVDLGRNYARLEEIAARVRVAFETLGSPERRAAYDQSLGAPSFQRDGRLDAEVFSQEGLMRLQRGDYRGAQQKLALAAKADDEQPDYHALLGWTTYLTALGPGRESASLDRIRAAAILALPHLETALTIDPDHTDAHEFLGRIDAARGADDSAADHLEIVLDQAPTRPEALTTLEAALARRGDWRRLEQVYRRLIHRLADDTSERPLLVWWRLAELYRTRLQDPAAAKVALERVAHLAPDDPRPRRALADLLGKTPSDWQEAVQALRETWRLEPEDPAPGRSLYAAHLRGERWDAALVTAGALACRGALNEDSGAYLRQHRPKFLVRASETLDGVARESLRHPADDPALAAIFADVFAVSAPDLGHDALGVGAADQVTAASLPESFVRALQYSTHLLGVPTPAVFVRTGFAAEIHIGATRPPILLVGPQALATSDLLVLTFRLGRALSYLWPGRALAGALPSAELKEHLGAAFTLARPGLRFDDPEGRVAGLRARLSGRATSLAKTLRPHVEGLLADRKKRIHLSRFVTGMARTADRVGLVACNDLPTAARIVVGECAPGAEDELIDFAIGEAYLALRARLGLAIAV